jgi:hypothetical protein
MAIYYTSNGFNFVSTAAEQVSYGENWKRVQPSPSPGDPFVITAGPIVLPDTVTFVACYVLFARKLHFDLSSRVHRWPAKTMRSSNLPDTS